MQQDAGGRHQRVSSSEDDFVIVARPKNQSAVVADQFKVVARTLELSNRGSRTAASSFRRRGAAAQFEAANAAGQAQVFSARAHKCSPQAYIDESSTTDGTVQPAVRPVPVKSSSGKAAIWSSHPTVRLAIARRDAAERTAVIHRAHDRDTRFPDRDGQAPWAWQPRGLRCAAVGHLDHGPQVRTVRLDQSAGPIAEIASQFAIEHTVGRGRGTRPGHNRPIGVEQQAVDHVDRAEPDHAAVRWRHSATSARLSSPTTTGSSGLPAAGAAPGTDRSTGRAAGRPLWPLPRCEYCQQRQRRA